MLSNTPPPAKVSTVPIPANSLAIPPVESKSSDSGTSEIKAITLRAESDFKALPERGRPGGSSPDSQYFVEVATGAIWIGKCEIAAMMAPADWAEQAPGQPQYFQEYREWLGATLYDYLKVPCAETVLSDQKPTPSAANTYGGESNLACPHVMSKMVEKFHPYAGVFSEFELCFIPDLGEAKLEALPENAVVILDCHGTRLRVCFIEGHQFVQRDGLRLTVEVDMAAQRINETELRALLNKPGRIEKTATNQAQVNKILMDATTRGGITHPFYSSYRRLAKAHPSHYLTITTATGEVLSVRGGGAALAVAAFLYDYDCIGNSGGNIGYVIEEDKLGNRYAKTIKIDPGYAFGFFDKAGQAGRRIEVGTTSRPLQFEELNEADKAEFAEMAKHILSIPWLTIETLIRRFNDPQGLPPDRMEELLQKLLERRNTFLSAFAPEIDASVRTAVQGERVDFLARLAGKRIDREKEPSTLTATFSSTALAEAESRAQALQAHLKGATLAAAQTEANKREAPASPARPSETKIVPITMPCRVFQVPAVVANFSGREELLEKLTQALRGQGGGVISQAIGGLGGVGKTTLAARYVQQTTLPPQRMYDAVLWIYAERDIESQFQEAIETWFKEKVPARDAIVAFKRYMQGLRVLMVMDNVEASTSLVSLLPQLTDPDAHYAILITSREGHWPGVPVISLAGFSFAEGEAYIRNELSSVSHTHDLKLDEMKVLLETVAFLPLALAHAVAFIKAGHCSVKDYPQAFAKHQLGLSESLTLGATGHTLMTTYLLNLMRLPPLAETVLTACAWFAPEAIPVSLLESVVGIGPDHYPQREVDAALDALLRHGLLQSTSDRTSVSIHRLVQSVVKSWQQASQPAEEIEKSLRHWVKHLTTALDYDDKDVTDIKRAGHLVEHAEQLTQGFVPHTGEAEEGLIKLLDKIGIYQYKIAGQYIRAQTAWERVLLLTKKRRGPLHPEVAQGLGNLALSYRAGGDIQRAALLMREAFQIQEQQPEAKGNAEALTTRGIMLAELGRHHEALVSFDESLKVRPEDSTTLTNRGNVLAALGRPAEALINYDASLRVRAGDADTLTNRGVVLRALGRPAEALVSYDESLKVRPGDADALANRGIVLRALGRPSEALISYDESLKVRPGHEATFHNRGVVLHVLGRRANALVRDSRNRLEEAATLTNRGVELQALGRPLDALMSYEAALKLYPGDSITLYNQGNALKVLGRLPEALVSYEQSLQARPGNANTLINRGVVLEALGRYREALQSFEEILKVNPKHENALRGKAWINDLIIKTNKIPIAEKAASMSSSSPSSTASLTRSIVSAGGNPVFIPMPVFTPMDERRRSPASPVGPSVSAKKSVSANKKCLIS